jgi:hypothetical protein
MYSEMYKIDSEIMSTWEFKQIDKISDTYFIDLKDGSKISIHENFWIPLIREHKIDTVINSS